MSLSRWGEEIVVDRDRAINEMKPKPEYFLCSKFYPASGDIIKESHTRRGIVQAIENPYLAELYRQRGMPMRFLHVTLFVGCEPPHPTDDDTWQHGIAIVTPKDPGLSIAKLFEVS